MHPLWRVNNDSCKVIVVANTAVARQRLLLSRMSVERVLVERLKNQQGSTFFKLLKVLLTNNNNNQFNCMHNTYM